MKKPEFQDPKISDPITPLALTVRDPSSTTPDHSPTCFGKRRSLSSSSLDDPSSADSKPKKIMVDYNHLRRGFTKVSLPISSSTSIQVNSHVSSINNTSRAFMRRCSFKPYRSPVPANNGGDPVPPTSDSLSRPNSFVNPQSSSDVSAKIDVNYMPVTENSESPNSKRKMEERMKVMNEWWAEVIHEGEDDDFEETYKDDDSVNETQANVTQLII